MKFGLIFSKRNLWKTYIFKFNKNENIFNLNLINPFSVIGSNIFRVNKEYDHINADPFLFVEKDKLFIFYESKTDFTKGSIYVKSFDGQDWLNHGCVLKMKFHLSYPQVFRFENKIYMIPETEESGRLWLFESLNFPYNWKQKKILINDKLVDTNILINEEGIFLIGTNYKTGLCVYFSKNLINDFDCIYKENENNLASSRNAGNLIKVKNQYYRIFQDCSSFYGEKIGIAEILILNNSNYLERIISYDFFKNRIKIKNVIGHHHVSSIIYKEEQYLAIDLLFKDLYINTLLYALIKFINLFIYSNGKPKITFWR